MELDSSAYGLAAFVDVEVISEGGAGNFESGLSATRATGADVVATVNGTTAVGKGNELSINTSALDLVASVSAGYTGLIEFDITGGGALFQLGPDVVSNQQARIGIQSVFTGNLGGVAGRIRHRPRHPCRVDSRASPEGPGPGLTLAAGRGCRFASSTRIRAGCQSAPFASP